MASSSTPDRGSSAGPWYARTARRIASVWSSSGPPQAALIYQHATAERDRAIADALGEMIAARLADEHDDQGDEDR
jgi:hypothetical protein